MFGEGEGWGPATARTSRPEDQWQHTHTHTHTHTVLLVIINFLSQIKGRSVTVLGPGHMTVAEGLTSQLSRQTSEELPLISRLPPGGGASAADGEKR